MGAKPVFEEYLLFDLGNVQYIAWPDVLVEALAARSAAKVLITVFPILPETTLSAQWLQSLLDDVVGADDVFCFDFLFGVVLLGHGTLEDQSLDAEAREILSSHGTSWIHIVDAASTNDSLLPGPYVLDHKGLLWKVSRLYEDTANAFTVALRTVSRKGATPMNIQGSGQRSAIAAPSRIRARDPRSLPLQGVRITVKEIFNVKGLRTGLGSRAYTELYPPALDTSPAIQRLLDAGVEVLGMSKMCPMVLKAPPTQCVDVSAPFNPRGDGYHSPSGGSSGQAAAVASYPWLDFAVASDSTFSGRMPAQANGCFSLRPSLGALSVEGMWSGVPQFDTPCFFGRDVKEFKKFATCWYGDQLSRDSTAVISSTHEIGKLESPSDRARLRRSLILPPQLLNIGNPEQRQLLGAFVDDLQKFLDVPAERTSIDEVWNVKPPPEAGGQALKTFLRPDVATRSYIYTFWQKISAFYHDYRATLGKLPFMPPPKGIRLWDRARSVSPAQHEEALRSLRIYKRWLLDTYLQTARSNPILVLPLGEARSDHRDEWPGDDVANDQQLWEPLLIAPIIGAPELVVPAGQISYESRVSGRREPLPVCVSLMGLPGTDLELIDLVHSFLEKSGRATEVMVGRDMFETHARPGALGSSDN